MLTMHHEVVLLQSGATSFLPVPREDVFAPYEVLGAAARSESTCKVDDVLFATTINDITTITFGDNTKKQVLAGQMIGHV